MFYDFEQEKEVMEIARQALLKEKEYERANPKIDILNEAVEKLKSADFAKNIYEPFEDYIFESKVAIDLMYYKYFLRNLEESFNKDVHELLAQTYRNIRNIYEFVNIKPLVFGKGIDSSILENSIETVEEKLSEVLNETLDSLFYSLTPEQRRQRYEDRAVPLSKKLITEQNDPEDSISFSIKSCVVEDILVKIAFPGANWMRVKYLSESDDFGLVFDQDKLVNLVEDFEKQIKKLSKYIAVCI